MEFSSQHLKKAPLQLKALILEVSVNLPPFPAPLNYMPIGIMCTTTVALRKIRYP